MATKIPSGIFGLDRYLGGGFNDNSSTVVIGSSGAGKTILATQFLKKGLENGQEGIYITLDEPPEQIIHEAEEMGWEDIQGYIDREQFVFVDASGKMFSQFVEKELDEFVNDWKGSGARIVVDPLTPVLWSTETRYMQRDLISFLFRQMKRIGTVLCTLEEHGPIGDLSHPDTVIPMYLSDTVLHLRYVHTGDPYREASRNLKVVKFRRSKHSTKYHPYVILKGPGMLVLPEDPDDMDKKTVTRRLNALDTVKRDRIKAMMKHVSQEDDLGLDLSLVLSLIVDEYERPGGVIAASPFLKISDRDHEGKDTDGEDVRGKAKSSVSRNTEE